jgi:hypothetical protein
MELVVLIVILGLIFDFTNGFHDAANVVATPIATKVIRPAVAITIAAIFNFVGATQISGVAQTIATGLVSAGDVAQEVVLAAVVGAIVWNLVTWYFGLPSSSSYALIGGLIGAALAGADPDGHRARLGVFDRLALHDDFIKVLKARYAYLQVLSAGFLCGGCSFPWLKRCAEKHGDHHAWPLLGRPYPNGSYSSLGDCSMCHVDCARDGFWWV